MRAASDKLKNRFCRLRFAGGSSCHESCPLVNNRRYCWGPSKDQCQKIVTCDRSKCPKGFCFFEKVTLKDKSVTTVERCCNMECAGGCTGPEATDCLACRNFRNGDECVRECPRQTTYDKVTFSEIDNPDPRFTYGSLCVKKCPLFSLITDSTHCFATCNLRTHFLKDGNKCIKCYGDKCKGNCIIGDLMKSFGYPPGITFTPRRVIKHLRQCTQVAGTLKIIDGSYYVKRPKHRAYANDLVRPQDLENLKNIRIFLGMMFFDFNFENKDFKDVKNMSFLSNLETLRAHKDGFQLSRSNVTFLGLRSLRYVIVEKFYVFRNKHLCYTDNFKAHFQTFLGHHFVTQNAKSSTCKREGHVCDPQCLPSHGCWGPGPEMCVRCRSRRAGIRCVSSCDDVPGFFTNSSACVPCHPLCRQNCSGSSPTDCFGQCLKAKMNNTCMEKCPQGTYKDVLNQCLPCSPNCTKDQDKPLCSGPASRPGPGGCTFCAQVLVSNSSRMVVERCLKAGGPGFYTRGFRDFRYPKRPTAVIAHVPCHPLCKTCTSDGPRYCECRHFKENSVCVANCSENTYDAVKSPLNSEMLCQPCSPVCVGGCTGPLNNQCKDCKIAKIYTDQDRDEFYCDNSCPKNRPYASSNKVCIEEPMSARVKGFIGGSIAVFVVICVITSACVICFQRKRAIASKNRELQEARCRRQLPEMIPLKETDKMPNSQLLRLIGADQLKKGLEIGSGAFGTVFVGIWRPPKEKPTDDKVEIKVAIKTLKDGAGDGQNALMTNEFLSEAHVMATVDHPFCISLLGVCMTSQMQLISDYMPLGSLVDYLPKHRHELGSQQLLTWAVQIAKGMVYLESLGIIHRDLAARNVLLESIQQVRITDFGLAKLIDEDVEFCAEGGRFPVKWLALECLRHRIFSHKSDVWAFGVTLWEVFTFGQRPYTDVRATELIDYLNRGERLLQPDICTLDIYMLMIKCWLADPDGRPTFEELVGDLSKMAADPARYLVVPNDGTLRLGTNRSNSAVSNASAGRHRSPNFPRHSRSQTPDSGRGVAGASGGAPAPNPSVSSNDDGMARKPPVRVKMPQDGLVHLADEVARRNAESRTRRPNSNDTRYAAFPSIGDEGDVFEDYLTPTEGATEYLIPNQHSDYLETNTRPKVEYYNEIGGSPAPAYVNAPHLNGALPRDMPDGDYLNPQLLSGRRLDDSARRSPEYRDAGPVHDYYNGVAMTNPLKAGIEEADLEEDADGPGDYLLPRQINSGVANPQYTGIVSLKDDKSSNRYLPIVGKRSSPPKMV